ncbi:MAG: hypothetical protein FJY76_00510 [Candidatus Aenigmarchaeota archaeon]|nr:hypothetical protein [Candidatus Aenigmarchaeota archaeon]
MSEHMEQSEIVRACLERGLLVSIEDIRRVEAGLSIDELLASKQPQQAAAKPQPADEEKAGRLSHRFRKPKAKETIAPSDILEQQKSRYEALKGMLLSKTSAVSIGNARDSAASVSLIGAVKRATENGFVLEDVTGEIDVLCDSSKAAGVEEGDVVCVRGPVKGGRLLCKDIIYPDVPLLRPVGRMEASMLIMPKAGSPAAKADIVLSAEPVEAAETEAKSAKNIVVEASPSHLTLYKDGSRFNILFCRTESEISQQAAINMLKKRSLKKPKGMIADNDAYLIEPVPDILWIAGKASKAGAGQAGHEWIETYKAVTIISLPEGSGKQAFINLRTREAKLI